MSEVSLILTSRADIKRFTASVVDSQVVVTSINATRQPKRAAKIEVSLQGCSYTGTGVVTINGNTSESLNFTSDGIQVGQLDFSSLTGLSFSGISGGHVKARAVSNMGQPINLQYVVAAGISCRFFQNAGFNRQFQAGQQIAGTNRIKLGMMLEPIADIAENDYVYGDYGIVGITVMQVSFYEALYDFAGATHHIEAWLQAI